MYRITIITVNDQKQITFETQLQAFELYDLSSGIRIFLHKRIKDGWELIQRKEV
jgi:hypothetical protein